MANDIDFTGNSDLRDELVTIIIERLYPEEKFPPRLFPDLPGILIRDFIQIAKSDAALQERLRDSREEKKLIRIAAETLSMKNLLARHPRSLILIYRYLITKYIGGKHQEADERDDIVQEIISRLLGDKIFKIQKQYDFNFKKSPSFTSYFMVTVRNIYIDIIRERKNRMFKTVELSEIGQQLPSREFEPEKTRLFIDEEILKLDLLLKMYHRSRPKLEIILKIKFRIAVNASDVHSWFSRCSPEDVFILTRDFKFMKDKEVFEAITPVFNRYENKRNKSDTLRKWIAAKIDELIQHLNRTHDHQVYHTENFSDLMALYYQRPSLKRDRHDI